MGIENLDEVLSWRVLRTANLMQLAVRIATENVREVIETVEPKGITVSLAETTSGTGYVLELELDENKATASIDADLEEFVVWDFKAGTVDDRGGLISSEKPLDHPASAILKRIDEWVELE